MARSELVETRGKDDSPPSSPDPPTNQSTTDDDSTDLQQHSNHSETHSRGSSHKYVSKIVMPSPRRTQDGADTLERKSPTMGVRNDVMYERSKLRLAAKERHLKQTEKKMMEGCTFTPETNKSRGSSNSGNTTVFDRLYSESKKTTPTKSNAGRDSQKKSPTSVSSHGSNRIDHLYQDGLRKAQNRRLMDKEEAEARRRRLEEKELEHCTFRPNMDWRKKKATRSNEKQPRNPGKKSAPQYQYSPPVHVVTTQPESARNGGRRKSARSRSIVSPLRTPVIPSRAAVPTGTESLGDDTEYGSI